jgi:hypothetical protein
MHFGAMSSLAGPPATFADPRPRGGTDCFVDLPELLERMQTAAGGNPELDARIDCLLRERTCLGMTDIRSFRWCDGEGRSGEAAPAFAWSEDFAAVLSLMPEDFNFSTGQRDGVCWAWIQPNDEWMPGPEDMRHDHPRGSGLLTAYTVTLALMAAVLMLRDGARPGSPARLPQPDQ